MRKLFIFLIFILLFMAYQLNGFLLVTKEFNGMYSIYKENSAIENEYNLSLQQALLRKLQGNTKGESVRFLGSDEDIDYLIDKLNIKVIDEQEFANIRTVYGYSARLGKGVKVGQQQVNIQLARRGGTITIGTPLILGSY